MDLKSTKWCVPDIEAIGRSVVNNFCHGYPHTTQNSFIPSWCPGGKGGNLGNKDNEDNQQLSLGGNEPDEASEESSQIKRLSGKFTNDAEKTDAKVFDALLNLSKQTLNDPILIVKHLSLRSHRSSKLQTLLSNQNLPGLQSEHLVSTEYDAVVFVKDLGVVLIEIRQSNSENNIRSAEQQLNCGENFIRCLWEAIQSGKSSSEIQTQTGKHSSEIPLQSGKRSSEIPTQSGKHSSEIPTQSGKPSSEIPISRIIIIPNVTGTPSPTNLTDDGSHVVFADVLNEFSDKWQQITEDLTTMRNLSDVCSSDFERLVHVVCGVWSIGPMSLRKMWASFEARADDLLHRFITPVRFMREDADVLSMSEKYPT